MSLVGIHMWKHDYSWVKLRFRYTNLTINLVVSLHSIIFWVLISNTKMLLCGSNCICPISDFDIQILK